MSRSLWYLKKQRVLPDEARHYGDDEIGNKPTRAELTEGECGWKAKRDVDDGIADEEYPL
jgi:hypothetical protein